MSLADDIRDARETARSCTASLRNAARALQAESAACLEEFDYDTLRTMKRKLRRFDARKGKWRMPR